MSEEEEGKKNWLIYLIGIIGVAAVAGGGLIFFQTLPGKAPEHAAGNAFDLDRIPEESQAAPGPPAAPAPARPLLSSAQTNLTPISLGAKDKPYEETAPPPQKKTLNVSEAARVQAEERIHQLAIRYTQKYPVIERYGREWMSYPDLSKIANDYAADHDAAKFMQGLAQSKNFPLIIKKYAGSQEVRAFVMDGLKQAPGEALAGAAGFFKDEKAVKGVVGTVLSALGLPSGILDGAENGTVDQASIINSVTKGNPQLEKLMENPETQKALQKAKQQ